MVLVALGHGGARDNFPYEVRCCNTPATDVAGVLQHDQVKEESDGASR